MRLLVAEDDEELATTLRKILQEGGFAVDVAPDGDEALFQAREVPYDAIVLDLMLPGIDGWTVLDTLRREQIRTPVIALTARDALSDRVRGLNSGADDYVTKPFAVSELLARIGAVIRRNSADPSPVLSIGDVSVDTSARRVERAGRLVDLTAREYAILEFLLRRRGTLVTRRTIEEHIYADDCEVGSNVIDVHVAGLRRKLGRTLVQTRRGQGYLIDA
ncbi:MAG: response regulator transcription factor [Vicinamibacterales bacterium]